MFQQLKNENSLFQVDQGISLLNCPLKHILNSEETICSRHFTELLRLATHSHAQKEEGKEKTTASARKTSTFSPWCHVFGYVPPWRNVEIIFIHGTVLEN